MPPSSSTREADPAAPRILLLAGSSEASALARRLADSEAVTVISSFAGRVRDLSLPPGQVRVGGFGGTEGLTSWLREESIDAVIDATHPFTAVMPRHAQDACAACGIPRLRLLRPEWVAQSGDDWHLVPDLDAAAAELEMRGARRVFLTIGRQELAPFGHLTKTIFLVRAIEAPDPMPLERAELVLQRGPFTLEEELDLMTSFGADALVSKNSGGSAAAAKLEAARQLTLPVIMVTRPEAPAGPMVTSVSEALAWCAATFPGVSLL